MQVNETTPAAKTSAQHNVAAGLLYALAGFGCLSLGDGLIKSLGQEWPGTAVAALRYTIGALGLGLVLLIKDGPKGFRMPLPKVQFARAFFVSIATLTFFSSIFTMPLATATAIQFVAPLLTAVISALLFGEKLSRSRWIATMLAFVGVMIVLRPSFADLGITAILPLIAAFGMSGLIIANGKVAGSGSVLLMQFLIASLAAPQLVLAAVIGHASGYAPLAVDWPGWHVIVICTIVAVTASFSHMLIYVATIRSSAATVAPMVYVQILVAIGIGVIFYNDYPDLVALAGTALIIASGLYLWRQSRG